MFRCALVLAFGLLAGSVLAQPANDNFANAVDVTAFIGGCSGDAAYTTVGGTADLNKGSCWNTGAGPNYNVWFKFTAPASGKINVIVDVGGTKGTQQRSQVAIWQSNGTTEVSCNLYVNNTDDVTVGAVNLTPGNSYYISVDAQSSGYRGTFSLCLSNIPDYDYYEGAIDVTSLINSCSADAIYSTIGGTSDKNPGSCWNTSGGTTLYNRWFKFTAPASGSINVTVDIGGAQGTQQRSQLAIWQANGTTQLACNLYVNNNDDVTAAATGLTPGNTYYISVDAQSSGYRGTFSLCLSSIPDYDYYEGAIDVTSLINSCSADAIYSTIGGTSDKNPGSCWNTSGGTTLYNRWFKFTAPASGSINVTVDIGGAQGTQQRSQLAIWQANGTTQLACNLYVNNNDDVTAAATGLTPGNTYYISVDAQSSGYRGTFSLCLSSIPDYDYYEGAINVTSLINSCSADAIYSTIGGTSDKNPGSCWNTSGGTTLYNRWFKFTAPASGSINVTVDIGGAQGTQQRTELAIWQANGTTQLACNLYVNNNDDVTAAATGLTPGNTYYISVDAQSSGYRGTFSLCLSSIPDYDYYEGAIDVTSLINSCSADAVYTTIGGTSDKNPGSCWNTSGGTTLYNRWFKFTAPASGKINVLVDIGGGKGTQQRTELAIWQANGTTQVACNLYVNNNDDVTAAATGLTPGNTYYISVDAQSSGYRGTFSLCLSDIPDYDYYEGAIDVTSFINSCSADAVYSTIGGTSDKNPGSCWNTSGGTTLYNRWFKFTAPASGSLNVTVDIGGGKGTQQRTELAIWQANGTTQVACNLYVNNTDDVTAAATGLTPGNTYYISVDAQSSGYRGTFSLCLSDVPDYDYYEGAYLISDINNWCSSDAQFTTIGGTSDKNPGSCWNTAGGTTLYNRWFKFVASATGVINVTVDIGGVNGTQQRSQVALWQSNGTTQIACNNYVNNTDDVSLGATGLTPGNTYYISVDVQSSGYRGTFSLCVTDVIDYDYYAGAIELTDLNNWCSADAVYTTIGGTSDKIAGSCWNTTGGVPLYNRWFKFQAVSPNVTIIVDIGAGKGTQQRTQLALWQANGTTQVACARYVSNGDHVSISSSGLVVGNVYYISVDAQSSGYRGTFSLCVNNIGTTYYSRADGAWNLANTWSTVGYGGVAATSFPGGGDVANIRDNAIIIGSAQQAAEINISSSTTATTMTVGSAALTVNGKVTLSNTAAAFPIGVTVQSGGIALINDNLNLVRQGGSQPVSVTVQNGAGMTVNKDVSFSSTAGTGSDNTVTINGTGTLTVNEDILFNSTGGVAMRILGNNTSAITVKRDISFSSTAAAMEEVQLNNSASLKMGRNFVRGATAYGLLTCNNTSTVQYNSGTYLQTFAKSAGAGGDSFSYMNVVINNTRITTPQVTMEGAATINGNLTMTLGIVQTTGTNILNLKNASTTTIGSTTSYIDGPMTYEIAAAGSSTRNFPVGKSSDYRPLVLTVSHTDATSVIYTVEHMNTSAVALGYTLPPTIDRVSGARYWKVNRQAVANLVNARVRLYYGYGTGDGVSDFANLSVAKNVGVGTAWVDVGGTASGNGTGNILSGLFTSFCDITLANEIGGTNTLPIELKSFVGRSAPEGVRLEWITSSESNSDYFEVQRSDSGEIFEDIGRVTASGDSREPITYAFTDEQPLHGQNYFRLKLVDKSGLFRFSKIIEIDNAFEFSRLKITPYPNPSHNSAFDLHVQAPLADRDVFITVYDNLGRVIYQTTLYSNELGSDKTIDLSGKAREGTYVISASQGLYRDMRRLIIIGK